MIVYQKTLFDFINDSKTPIHLVNEILSNYSKRRVNDVKELNSEELSWYLSLPLIANTLNRPSINQLIDVAVEYTIHQSQERIDFIIYGVDDQIKKSLVIIELKQWSQVRDSNKPFYVYTFGGGGLEDYQHPSYQAYNYLNSLKLLNEYVQLENIELHSCAYLHNLRPEFSLIKNPKRYPLTIDSPVFLMGDEDKLFQFVSTYVKKPYKMLIYDIDNGRIIPSKKFADMFKNAISGNPTFSFDDKQMNSIATIIEQVKQSENERTRKTILIKGSPGTGKSIVALNAIGLLMSPPISGKVYNAVYTTANAAPRNMFEKILEQEGKGSNILTNILKSPAVFGRSSEFDFDCVLVDEAHRIYKWKFGIGVPNTVDILDKIFYASRVNVFFIDEEQAVTDKDFATIERIKEYAVKYKSQIIEGPKLSLTTQFRVLGGDRYIKFVKQFLGYENTDLKYIFRNYDFRVFDNPSVMREELRKKNDLMGNCRMIAGYTYEWTGNQSERTNNDFHIQLEGGFKAKWNLKKNGNYSFVSDEDSFDEVGCIHTIQGIDLNYAGVIIGKDLTFNGKELVFDKKKNAKSDKTSGIRTASDELAKRLIRNTYNVLLTRGIHGTYVYCEDKALSNYLKSLMGK